MCLGYLEIFLIHINNYFFFTDDSAMIIFIFLTEFVQLLVFLKYIFKVYFILHSLWSCSDIFMPYKAC
mgnify:CR=1 FL=1